VIGNSHLSLRNDARAGAVIIVPKNLRRPFGEWRDVPDQEIFNQMNTLERDMTSAAPDSGAGFLR
jgi:hypothetical protein